MNDDTTPLPVVDRYAEDAVRQHMPRLQAEFDHQNTPNRNPTAPFLELDSKEVKDLMNRGMRRSERWRHMKYDLKKSDEEIIASLSQPVQMSIFAWKNGQATEIDTVMKPRDSMRYYKSFLQSFELQLDQ